MFASSSSSVFVQSCRSSSARNNDRTKSNAKLRSNSSLSSSPSTTKKSLCKRAATVVTHASSESKVSSKHLPGKIILQGENNLEVTPAIRAYVEEKLAKAVANADPRDVREIDCRVASRGGADHATKGAHVCTTKATVLTRAGQIEVVEEHEDLYASIDKVADGLKRQLRKFTEKREGNARGKKEEILMAAGSQDDDEDEVPPAA
ncbi:unnamed protein product [Bathycoccus prasinos]